MVVDIENGTTHDDGLMEEIFSCRHTHQRTYLSTTTRLSEDSDIRGIASEVSDVVAYPFECLYDIEHTHIARIFVFIRDCREIEEAEDIETMVDADNHYTLLSQLHTRIPCRGSHVETTPMKPQHHRFACFHISGPNVQYTGVLFRHLLFTQCLSPCLLHHLRPPMVADTYTFPFIHWQRRHTTLYFGIRNA